MPLEAIVPAALCFAHGDVGPWCCSLVDLKCLCILEIVEIATEGVSECNDNVFAFQNQKIIGSAGMVITLSYFDTYGQFNIVSPIRGLFCSTECEWSGPDHSSIFNNWSFNRELTMPHAKERAPFTLTTFGDCEIDWIDDTHHTHSTKYATHNNQTA